MDRKAPPTNCSILLLVNDSGLEILISYEVPEYLVHDVGQELFRRNGVTQQLVNNSRS